MGAATLLFGAIISCAKDDIKKALAGSTMSQIGYMVLAAGLGPIGYVFAIKEPESPEAAAAGGASSTCGTEWEYGW